MDAEEQGLRWTGPAEQETATEIRRAIQGSAARAGLPTELADQITLASYEAIINVVAHAYAEQPGSVSVRIERDEDSVVVVVSDQGRWHASRAAGLGGRGLALMEAMAKELTGRLRRDRPRRAPAAVLPGRPPATRDRDTQSGERVR